MSGSSVHQPSSVDALALLTLPAYNTLTEGQARGAACIWCAVRLTTETAVDFGERRHKRLDGRFSTFPRACRPCTHDAAYRTLLDHAPSCEQCTDDADSCETGLALRRLMRECR